MTLTLLRAEVYKIITLRYWWILPAVPLLLGVLVSAGFAGIRGTLTGFYYASGAMVIAAGIFGALTVTTETWNGTLTPTYLAAPTRDDAITAKLIVTAAFAAVYGLLAQVITLGAALAAGRGKLSMSWELLGATGGGLAATICWAVLWAGTAWLTGTFWGPIAAVASWLLAELIVWLAASAADAPGFAGAFPGAATISAITGGGLNTPVLLPGQAAVILLALWTAGAAVAGWWVARVRDVT